MDYEKEEAGVSFLGLLLAPLKKWRALLALLLVGALIGAGVAMKQMKDQSAANAERAAWHFDETALNMVSIQLYHHYDELYQAEVRYEESNLLLRMDPNSVYSGLVSYFITTEQKNIETLTVLLNSVLKSDLDRQKLYRASGLDCTPEEFDAMISVRFSVSDQRKESEKVTGNDTSRSGVLSFCAAMEDEAALLKVMEAFVSVVEEKTSEIKAEFPENFTATQTLYQTTFGYSDFVVNAIRNAAQTRIAIEKEMNALKEKLSDEEMAYYKYHYLGEIPSAGAVSFPKLTVAIGALTAVILGYLWFVGVFLFDGKLHDINAICEDYGLHLLSVVPGEEKKNFLDRLVMKMANAHTVVNDIAYAGGVLSSLGFGEAILVGNAKDRISQNLAAELASGDSRLSVGAFAVQDIASFKAAAEKEVILVLHIDKEDKATLERELSVYAKAGREVLGFIAVR